MKPRIAGALLAAGALAAGAGGSAAGTPTCEPCETSAAVVLEDGRVVVGDNETKDRLFAYRWGPSGARPAAPFEIPWDAGAGRKVEDIEALARDGGTLWVVGSHSRKKSCERDWARFRLLHARIAADRLRDPVVLALPAARGDAAWRAATSTAAACLAQLFTADAQESATARRFCEALVAAETAADEPAPTARKARCQRTLNVEGAAVLGGRLWLGLRAPLVGPEGDAVLLRVREEGSGFRFDAAALVRLGGRGIRELAPDGAAPGTALWGICGPVEDRTPDGRTDDFALWRIDPARVQPEARLDPEREGGLAPVPASSEGLAVGRETALLWIDGDGKYPEACKTPHATKAVPLP